MTDFNFLNKQSGHKLDEGRVEYPYIQWVNGKPELKQLGGVQAHGGFMFKADQLGGESFPIGEKIDWAFSNGESSKVWAIGAAAITVLAERIDWYIEKGDNEREYLPHYQKGIGAKGRNRWLVFVRGAEGWHQQFGPLMLTIGGSNGIIMTKDVVREFRSRVHKAIEAATEKEIDSYTFWMKVKPGKYTVPNPQYTTKTTPPVLDISAFDATNPLDYAEKAYIGDDLMALAADWWERAQEWANETYGNDNDDSDEKFTYPASDNGDSDFTSITSGFKGENALPAPPHQGSKQQRQDAFRQESGTSEPPTDLPKAWDGPPPTEDDVIPF